MMYITLTLLAGVISFMFVATAVSSVVNAVRENAAAREALSRNAAF
jgi:ABC-type polysaccharide/polyol phosphate export permease